jgi:hypothetical protein
MVVDFSNRKQIDVPDAWKSYLEGPRIDILPLVDDSRRYPDGWCTYTYEHTQAPELEIICGGTNAKTPQASAIWRQGNLLHFGFEQSPADLNRNGQAMLVNSICYVTRFRDSRPIIRRSPLARILDRDAVDRLIKNNDRELEPYLDWFFSEKLRDELVGKTRDELREWFHTYRDYLTTDKRGKFLIDEGAMKLGAPTDSLQFLRAAIARLDTRGGEEALARELLNRYAPSGPGTNSQSNEWRQWFAENQDYLFFSDSGGFRWYIDPLAKQRKVPTHSLRGAARENPS